MATASVSAEPNERECSICHEQFTEPKLLPCGHLLCRHCVLSWIQTQDEALCPLCRCAIVEPKESKRPEDIADEFPTDLAMSALVEANRLLNKDHSCCVCEDVAATSLCLNCGDMLCKSCKKAHGKLSALKHHIVEDLSSLSANKLAANCPSTCAAHPEEPSKLFCPTHGASICLLCATSKHRSCPEVKDLEEKAEEARALLAELADKLSEGERKLDQAINELDEHFQDTEKRVQAAIAEMEAMCDRLESAVKACRRHLKDLAVSSCSDVKEAVTDGKTCLLKRRGKLTTHKHVIERVQGMKNRDVVSNMTSTMQTRVADLDSSVSLPDGAKTISTITLTINQEVVSDLEKKLSQLGQVQVVPADIAAVTQSGFTFHDNHGFNIVLTNNKRTAERQQSEKASAIVMSRQPMNINTLYEVRIDKWSTDCRPRINYSITVGVTTLSPDKVIQSSWCAGIPSVTYAGLCGISSPGISTSTQSAIISALKSLNVGSRVGVSVDSNHCLHVHVDGKDLGAASSSLSQPCYAVFDVSDYPRQVTALPVTKLPLAS